MPIFRIKPLSSSRRSRKPPQPQPIHQTIAVAVAVDSLKQPHPSSEYSDNHQTNLKRQRNSSDDHNHKVDKTIIAKRNKIVDGGVCVGRSSSPPPVLVVAGGLGSDDDDEEIQMAARAARLKARYASTIVKASQRLLFNSTNEDTNRKIKSYQQSQTQKAHQLQLVAKPKPEPNLSKERDAAYVALLEIERNVVVEDNFKTMRELDMLMSGHRLF